jgi:hypothetical protein
MSFPNMAALGFRAVCVEYTDTPSLDVGQLGMTPDGSMYRLCKAGAAMTNPMRYKQNYNRFLGGVATTGEAIETSVSTAIAVGDMSVVVADATNSRAADYYKGGYVCQPRASGDNTMYITSSDAESSDTYRLHVAAPFTVTYDAASGINVYPSPYNNVRDAGTSDAYEQVACMANIDVTSGYYFWGKVRGPHWCWIYNTWPGAALRDREVVFMPGGTIMMVNDSWPTYSDQHAGHLMYYDNYGDALIYVQIE